MYRVIRGDQHTEHTSVEDEQSIPQHNSNLNKKKNTLSDVSTNRSQCEIQLTLSVLFKTFKSE
jgi:hypothetical protein